MIFFYVFVACYVYFSLLPKASNVKERKIRLFATQSSNLTHKSGSILRAAKTIVLQGRDVRNCSDDSLVMADKAKKKTRGNYRVAGGPNLTNCENNSLTPGNSMHYFPKNETLWKKWTLFVRVHRKDFVPSKSATLCSVHFHEKRFERRPVPFTSAETGKAIQPKRYLIKGSVPTRYAVAPPSVLNRLLLAIVLQFSEQLSELQLVLISYVLGQFGGKIASKRRTTFPFFHSLRFLSSPKISTIQL